MATKKKVWNIGVIDFETDPFKYGREPEPFAADFYEGTHHATFWGDQCVRDICYYLNGLDGDWHIYAHNGGKFDFYYLLRAGVIGNPIKIINGRIVEATFVHEGRGEIKLRDSYAIIPIPLAAYQKDEIDYEKFERPVRQKHKPEIVRYLHSDCEYLFNLVSAFRSRFGNKLTIGSTAMGILKGMHPFDRASRSYDEKFRPFYFGGRVQAFETGIVKGDFSVFDVNSMYPYVMREKYHPAGKRHILLDGSALDNNGFIINGHRDQPYFIHFSGRNLGAIPTRTATGLNFNIEQGEFWASHHEIQAGLKYGLIRIDTVHSILAFHEWQKFDTYVDTFMAEKISAKEAGDSIGTIFAKLLLNSAYGKFGQNSDNYFDYRLISFEELSVNDLAEGWTLYADYGEWGVFRKPSTTESYFDVAVAASITSAARAVLLEALQFSKRPIYCDTDSIICESLQGVTIDPLALGAWDLEKQGDTLAVAGKKLYALFQDGECVKLASKGIRAEAQDILNMCKGETVTKRNDAPNFKLDGSVRFVQRSVKMI